MKTKLGKTIAALALLLGLTAVIFLVASSQAQRRGRTPGDWLPEDWRRPGDRRDEDRRRDDDGRQDRRRDEDGRRDEDRRARGADVAHAETLWRDIKDYPTWPVPKGLEGWQRGESPHGRYLRYYYNYAAKENLNKNLAVIVKENYSARDRGALRSVTVMQKRKGYDPENKDWFYVQYDPDGEVMSDRRGRKIAGAVGEETDRGCISCHERARGNDYLFMND
ncbi:MAG: cytochrome P460 family protein [Phycisphaerae bacterium]|nr:cytochrome P460 family protein [Phycisphaerae bacterium]